MTEQRQTPRLMLVTDRRRSPRSSPRGNLGHGTRLSLPELVAAAVAGGVDAVQLREPDLEPAALRALAIELREAIGGQAALLINRDAAVAAEVGAGVHLPEAGPDAASVRRQIGSDALMGRSVHSAAGAAAATRVDYLLAGHVFATASKPGQPPLGPAGLEAIVAASAVPVLAIGGITPERVGATFAAGAVGVAVIGAIAEADDPHQAACDLRTAIERAREQSTVNRTEAIPTTTEITATINGKPTTLPAGSTITAFITGKGFTADMVIVELNGEIVPRPAYATTVIAARDRLEIVHAVGGG